MNKGHLLTFDREATKGAVLKQLGRNEKDFENDIEILEAWLKTQKHLPQITSRNMLEWFLVGCKFSIEKCKQKLDMYYTLKTNIPELFKNKHPKHPHMKRLFDVGVALPLPTLTKSNERIIFTTFFDPSEDRFWELYFASSLAILELRLREDICRTHLVVCDMANFNFNVMLKLNPMTLNKFYKSIQNAYAGRIAGFHYINAPSFIDNLVSILKSIVSEKLAKLIYVHDSLDAMFEHIPKDIFPKEYGGSAPPISELLDLWKQKLKDNYALFDQIEEIQVNESLRPEPLKNDEMLGFYGNFKKLNVD